MEQEYFYEKISNEKNNDGNCLKSTYFYSACMSSMFPLCTYVYCIFINSLCHLSLENETF